MRNIFLGLMVMSVLLPQVSFGADDALTTFNKKQDADRIAFAQQQAQERSDFIKGNQPIIDKQNRRGKWVFEHKARHQDMSHDASMPEDLTPSESGTIASFMQRQRSECQVFARQQAQEKQKFLGSS